MYKLEQLLKNKLKVSIKKCSIVNSQEKYLSNTKKEQGFLLENGQFKIKKPKEKVTEAIDPQWDTHLQ